MPEEIKGPLVSIILPIYNQAKHIERVTTEYRELLKRFQIRYEFILVTNGCHDQSENICQNLSIKFDEIHWASCERRGWGRAIKLGLQQARGNILCYTNSARTSAEILALFLFYSKMYPTVVIKANRKIRDNCIRRIGSLLYNLEARLFFDLAYWDINGTPKVFPRKFDRLLDLTRDDDLIDLEFNIICRKEDYPMLEIPIFSKLDREGKSTTNLLSAMKMYLGAFSFWRKLGDTSNSGSIRFQKI